jgi:DNA-binding IclR family transcriptional regulator
VAVTFPSGDLDDAARRRLAERVARAAAELTRRLGGRAPDRSR